MSDDLVLLAPLLEMLRTHIRKLERSLRDVGAGLADAELALLRLNSEIRRLENPGQKVGANCRKCGGPYGYHHDSCELRAGGAA